MTYKKFIIGIDEVGRGCLAGPVTAAAVLLPRNFQFSILNFQRNSKIKLRDSKKLTQKQREIWFGYIRSQPLIFCVRASVSPAVIDRINIAKAANLAATRALARLLAAKKLTSRGLRIFLDGGLYLNAQILMASGYWLNPKTIPKGDEKIPAIMLASIVAKVSRDRRMTKLHKIYPHYRFDEHKGYGTKKHVRAIKKHGFTPIHRRSFKIKN